MNRICLVTTALVCGLTFELASAAPIAPIPAESGVSGSIVGGVSQSTYTSNLVAGPGGDSSRKTTSSLYESATSESSAGPLFTGELNYTFGESRTQIYFGTELEDLVRYDLSFQLGARKALSNGGIVYGSFLFSGVPTEVYTDPYVVNTPRAQTDRKSSGARIGLQNAFGSGFGAQLSVRDVSLGEELSGTQLVIDNVISAEEQKLLNREGSHMDISLSYTFRLGESHLIVPEIKVDKVDLDGGARARDQIGATLAYFYNSAKWSLVTTAFFSQSDMDETNPIYDTKESVDNLGASVVLTYNQLFNTEDLSLFVSAAAGEANSNIDFYDQDLVSSSLGVIYQF